MKNRNEPGDVSNSFQKSLDFNTYVCYNKTNFEKRCVYDKA